MNGCAGAGNVVANGEPHAALQVGAAFHRVGAAHDAGKSQFDIEVAGSGDGEVQCARSIQRVSAAGALSGVEGGEEFLRVGDAVAVASPLLRCLTLWGTSKNPFATN